MSAGLVSAFPSVASAAVPLPSFTVTTPDPTVAQPTDFDGTGTTDPNPPHTIASYTWFFGDGTHTATGATASHVY